VFGFVDACEQSFSQAHCAGPFAATRIPMIHACPDEPVPLLLD